MKLFSTLFLFLTLGILHAQSPITSVATDNMATGSSTIYTAGTNTYRWGVFPNNTTISVASFNTAGSNYVPEPTTSGTVTLRRVNNAGTSGNVALEWSQGVLSGSNINLFVAYEPDMNVYMNNNIYNQGADNFFDNVASNSNNIERMDYVLGSAFTTATPDKVGIPVFERGDPGGHDPFVIAVITGVDGTGKPTSYAPLMRVAASSFGDIPSSSIPFRIVKGLVGTNLVEVGSNTQGRGGVFMTLQSLGIAAGTPIYGYSILANDFPMSGTSANLVDWTNTTYFPNNTGFSGGIDMAAVVGLFTSNTVLPTRITLFNASNLNANVNLKWTVENANTIDRYEIERSEDGISFANIQQVAGGGAGGARSYAIDDNVANITSEIVYYRIKMFDKDGSVSYSKVVSVKLSGITSAFTVYPNPVLNNLFVNLRHATAGKAIISVLNTNGQRVLWQNENLAAGLNSFSVEGVEKLSKGIYILNISVDGGKLIKRRFNKQ